jgi:hypothetical protein
MRFRSAKLRLFIKVALAAFIVTFIIHSCFPSVTTWYPKKIFSTGDTRRIAQVAIDGDTLLVYGVEDSFLLNDQDKEAMISIYTRSGSDWVRQAQLPTDTVHPAGFIKHVGISGNTIVIANSVPKQTSDATRTASISIFNREGADWVEKAKLPIPNKSPTSPDLDSDNSVVIDGNTIVVSGNHIVHIFERNPETGVWEYQSQLAIPATADLSFRQDSISSDNKPLFVNAAISGNTVIVDGLIEGGYGRRSTTRIFVFERNPETRAWEYQTNLEPGGGDGYGCGGDIAIEGDTIMAGCPDETIWHSDIMGPIGAVYVFTRDTKTGIWSKHSRIEPNGVYRGNPDEFTRFFEAYGFGSEISLQGDAAVISAFMSESRLFRSDDTAAYLFRRDQDGSWQQQARMLPDPKLRGWGTSISTHHGAVSQPYVVIGDNSVPPEKGRRPRSGFYIFDLASPPQ